MSYLSANPLFYSTHYLFDTSSIAKNQSDNKNCKTKSHKMPKIPLIARPPDPRCGPARPTPWVSPDPRMGLARLTLWVSSDPPLKKKKKESFLHQQKKKPFNPLNPNLNR